jgi:hypothetical protein
MLVREPVACLECGLAGQLCRVVNLPRHLAAMHALTVEEYRARWTPRRREPVVTAAVSDAGILVNGRVQLPPGATWSDGRDAEQARQQQRDYRARRRRR